MLLDKPTITNYTNATHDHSSTAQGGLIPNNITGTGTSGQVAYFNGTQTLTSSSNLTFDGNKLALITTGNTGGLSIGGDTHIWRDAAGILRTNARIQSEISQEVLVDAGSGGWYMRNSAGTLRWIMRGSGTETGSGNEGYNLIFSARANDGASLSDVWYVKRATGYMGIGSTNPTERLTMPSTGKIGWEVSSGTVDTNLYRSAADTLKTDDTLIVGGNLGVGGSASKRLDVYDGMRIRQSSAVSSAALLEFTDRYTTWAQGFTWNAYYDGTWKRRTADYPALMTFGADGALYYGTAGSGAADSSITWTYPLSVLNSGYVGVGTTNPTEKLTLSSASKIGWEVSSGTVDTNLYRGAANQLKTDDDLYVATRIGVGIAPTANTLVYSSAQTAIASNTTDYVHGNLTVPIKRVAATFTDSGYTVGQYGQVFRNFTGQESDTSDNGTLAILAGAYFAYGHYNTYASATPTTTSAYGLRILPYYRTGTITNMYDLYLDADSTGGTATNRWGIYQNNTATNYFKGSIQIVDKDIILGTTTGTKIGTATTQKLGFYNATPVTQPTALTTALTTITAPAYTPDTAIQAVTNTSPYGFVNANEGNTVINSVANLMTRVAELETKLKALGLLA